MRLGITSSPAGRQPGVPAGKPLHGGQHEDNVVFTAEQLSDLDGLFDGQLEMADYGTSNSSGLNAAFGRVPDSGSGRDKQAHRHAV